MVIQSINYSNLVIFKKTTVIVLIITYKHSSYGTKRNYERCCLLILIITNVYVRKNILIELE